MSVSFRVVVSPQFKRDSRKIVRNRPQLLDEVDEVFVVLAKDPYDASRQFNIRKLKNISAGEGQWRIRFGDYRIRYDIFGQDVILHSFRIRAKAY
jgi:mRNA-degrading endonuclease RelE of RelBE toxin-antitoxin system